MNAQDTMQEIDPTPVEEGEGSPCPNDNLTSQKNMLSSNIGLSQHSPAYYLLAVQRYSSYAFSAFAAMHIANTSIIPLITQSVPSSEPYLLLTRPYYQTTFAEPLVVVLPLCAHILSGFALRIYRWNQNTKRYGSAYSVDHKKNSFANFWPIFSTISKTGYQLLPLILGHVVVNRVVPVMHGTANVGLDYVSHAFARHPAVSFTSLAALLSVGCFHMTWGWARWLGLTPAQVAIMSGERELIKKRRYFIVNAIAVASTILWAAGSFGVIARGNAAPGWIGKEYDAMYRTIPLIGRWT